MVTRRRRELPDDDPTAEFQYSVREFPRSDEDPALFWGPDWKERLDKALAEADAGLGDTFYSDEEFLAALDADSNG